MDSIIKTFRDCHCCDGCTSLGERKGDEGIHNGKFDTKEECCMTRVDMRKCPRGYVR